MLEAVATTSSTDRGLVIIETRSGKITTTQETLRSCDTDFFDRCLQPEWMEENRENGKPRIFLDVDHDVFTNTLLRMHTGALTAPSSYDEAFVREQRRQLRFLCHRPTLFGAFTPPGFVYVKPGLTREFRSGNNWFNFIARAFWCQQTPVTQEQWRSLMGNNPSRFGQNGPGDERADDRPVEMVSWYDAATYCNQLSLSEGLPEYYNFDANQKPGPCEDAFEWGDGCLYTVNIDGATSYRLPSRAEQNRILLGSDVKEVFGGAEKSIISFRFPSRENCKSIGWLSGSAEGRTHPVAQLKPSNEGIYDAYGNVWEWTDDPESYRPQLELLEDDGSFKSCFGPEQTVQVLRGASWEDFSPGDHANLFLPLSARYATVGFRTVRSIPGGKVYDGPMVRKIEAFGDTLSSGYRERYAWPTDIPR